jgi:ureidoglycolate lyase
MAGNDSFSPTAPRTIVAEGMTRQAYQPYGDLISADERQNFKAANNGTAKRFNHLSAVENLRPGTAALNLCVFRCQPLAQLPLEIKLLEKHQLSTQVFIPMTDAARFLTIVCLGGDEPELTSLKVFLTEGAQGVSYRPGIWHYPMTALEKQIDFSCLVWEDGSADDCRVFNVTQPILVSV